MKDKKKVIKWRLVQRSRIPISISWGNILIAFVCDNRGAVECLWACESFRDGFKGIQWEIRREGENPYWFANIEAPPVVSPIEGSGYANPLQTNNRIRREILDLLRQAVGTQREELPDWAKEIWNQGKDLVRSAIPPLKIADYEVDKDSVLYLEFVRNGLAAYAAQEILILQNNGTISISMQDQSTLLQMIAAGADLNLIKVGHRIVVTLTDKFDEESQRCWGTKISPGIKAIYKEKPNHWYTS